MVRRSASNVRGVKTTATTPSGVNVASSSVFGSPSTLPRSKKSALSESPLLRAAPISGVMPEWEKVESPIVQITGTAEFSEVFFNDARTAGDNIVGEVNGGWKVAMGTLEFERGASTLGQQMLFHNELDQIIEVAKRNGKAEVSAFTA